MKITFYKYQGTGNDFVIINNFTEAAPVLTSKQIRTICNRHFGIGADGLMLLNKVANYDFGMQYFNADGSESSMCGNGGRCLVTFAHAMGIHKSVFTFLAIDGVHEAELIDDGKVRLKMCNVTNIDYHNGHAILNTGSPHFVKFSNKVQDIDVALTGKEIRFSPQFAKDGINVNFAESLSQDTIYVRTYERGVEDETLSCGTGVTAAALLFAHNDNGFNTVEVKTPGGNLSVEFNKKDDQNFENIWLCGPAQFVFKGEIEI
jgi:diaminopimelate epimerase